MYDWPDNGTARNGTRRTGGPAVTSMVSARTTTHYHFRGWLTRALRRWRALLHCQQVMGSWRNAKTDRKKSKKKKKHTGCFTNDDLLQPAGTPAGPNIRREGGHNATSPCGANICLTSREVTPPHTWDHLHWDISIRGSART